MARGVDAAVAALRAGEPVVLPTDTVYGLCASPFEEKSVRRMYRLKGRDDLQPTALLAATVEGLLACVPELHEPVLRALLPGPFTLVLPNPARRFPWLCGPTPERIGVRVPVLAPDTRAVVEALGAVAATSANLHGGSDPRRLEDVPGEIRAGCGAALDGGPLPGAPSTVLDLSGDEPVVLRQGAVPAADALARVAAASRASG
jgi:L-threonylcarbamoyladenylate synthase